MNRLWLLSSFILVTATLLSSEGSLSFRIREEQVTLAEQAAQKAFKLARQGKLEESKKQIEVAKRAIRSYEGLPPFATREKMGDPQAEARRKNQVERLKNVQFVLDTTENILERKKPATKK